MKRIIVFALAALAISVSACQQRSTGITEPSTYSTPVTMTEVERTQVWIDRIDPFVTQDDKGYYSVDTNAFLSAYHPQGEDMRVAGLLMTNIAIANQHTKTARGFSVQGEYYHRYWWGERWMWWGTEARHIIYNIGWSNSIPLLGYLSSNLTHLLQGYLDDYGGFSLTHTWWNTYWYSPPQV